jgi:tricorn protease
LINEHAGSDGDIFPNAFRTLKLGPLIGTRTWGGVTGIRSDKPFIDGGMSTQPEFGWWSPTRGWAIENHGVDPDIEVYYRPEDYLADRDPQLDRAIDEMLKDIAQKPMAPVTRPADPDHPGGK